MSYRKQINRNIYVDEIEWYKDGNVPDPEEINLVLTNLADKDISSKIMSECKGDRDYENVISFCDWYIDKMPFFVGDNRKAADSINVMLKSLYKDNKSILEGIDTIRDELESNLYDYYYNQADMVRKYIFPDLYVEGEMYAIVLNALFYFLDTEEPHGDPSEHIPEMYNKGLIDPDIVETMIDCVSKIYKTDDSKDAERVVIWEPGAARY